jgi:hypothetical protein
VVLHHLDGLLRAPDAGLLHPAAGHGVRRVSRFAARSASTVGWAPDSRDAVHTPRRIPLVGSRTASPRPLPPCRSTRSQTSRPTAPRSTERREREPGGCPQRDA